MKKQTIWIWFQAFLIAFAFGILIGTVGIKYTGVWTNNYTPYEWSEIFENNNIFYYTLGVSICIAFWWVEAWRRKQKKNR